ncbi:MAG: transcriptional regulator YxaF [Ktedonobacteraceae bacterium]
MSGTRDHIIEVTSQLLEAQGYHATGLNQIIAQSGAPRGSLYYHFPQGKEELTAEAVTRAGNLNVQRIKEGLAQIEEPGEAIRQFIHNVAYHVEHSGFEAGGPLAIVAMETVNSSERLNAVCRLAYQQLQQAFADKLVQSGYTQERARQLATFVTASVEGGIILSRTNHNSESLRWVADELAQFIQLSSKD